MTPSTDKKSLWLGFALIALILIAIFAITALLLAVTSAEFVAGLIATVASVSVAIWQYRQAKQNEVNARHFEKKAPHYEEILDLFVGLFRQQKGFIEPVSESELTDKLMQIRGKLMVWAGIDVLDAVDGLSEPLNHLSEKQRAGELFKRVAKLYEEIRRDLGHNDPPGTGLKLVMHHVMASERAEFLRSLNP